MFDSEFINCKMCIGIKCILFPFKINNEKANVIFKIIHTDISRPLEITGFRG